MKAYLKDTIEWLAQKLIAMAVPRAMEILEEAHKREDARKALPAPRLHELELH